MTLPLLIGWPGGSLESALKLGAMLIIAYALVLWLSAVIWVYRDVRNRTSDPASQVIAVLLVATFNLPGLIVYLVIRPQVTMADAYERSLEAEAVLHELQITANACQSCRRPIEDDFNVCPHCRTVLREPCRTCSRLVRTSWVTCPYCATDRPQRLQAQPQQHAAPQHAPQPREREGVTSTEPMRPPARRSESARVAQRDLLQTSTRRVESSAPQGAIPSRPPARSDG